MTIDIKRLLRCGICGLAASGSAIGTASAATALQLTAGSEYSSGRYGGSTRTDTLVTPITARLRWNHWSLRASLPIVNLSGPADVTVLVGDDGGGDSSSSGEESSNSGSGSSGSGSGSDPDDGDDTAEEIEEELEDEAEDIERFDANRNVTGIGDASLALTYSFNDIAGSAFYVDATGRVKFATGSERKGLGVGATDYAATGELGWDSGLYGAYVGGGRRFLGDNQLLDRVDGWQAGGGAWVNVTPAVELGANVQWRSASVQGDTHPASADGTVTVRLSDRWRVSIAGGAGLSDGSADYFGGLTLLWNVASTRR